ncbi:MAG TPA: serine hydrolase domain-containing protein [Pseudomonadales bacterium]|nr:serine hydrolase domain-containing protein [Pseudomonadales bacterium]
MHDCGFDTERLSALPRELQRFVDDGDLSGFVTLVWRRGAIVRLDALGWRDIERRQPMQRDTLFRIASMTKPVTSVAALMLIEDGKLALDAPIKRWLPEFANVRVLQDPKGALDQTVAPQRDITVEDLFTHRAGLAYAFTSLGPIAKAYEHALPPGLAEEPWLAALGKLPLSYQPGERFHYSHATDVLGFLVGRIAGKPIRDVLRERIFGPLGMHDTDFFTPRESRHRAAVVYRPDLAARTLTPLPFPEHDSPPTFCSGGGGLISTADDYLKFARMLLGRGAVDGVRLLREDTVATMTRNRLTDAQRAIPFMGIPFWAGQGFGLGLSVITDPAKQAWMGLGSKGAFGWPGAFGTWWQADPALDMILIYLIQNSLPLGPEMASQLATGQRLGARAALPQFQRLVHGALAD